LCVPWPPMLYNKPLQHADRDELSYHSEVD
jgi:hypothetical protein